jgi:hypothetical protein
MYREAVGEYQKALNLQKDPELAAAIGESFDRGDFPAATRTSMNGLKLFPSILQVRPSAIHAAKLH